MTKLNDIELSQKLISFKSYSGYHKDILEFLGNYLTDLGFECDYLDFDGDNSYKVNNLHAVYNPNKSEKVLYFSGHTDVVNEGDITKWNHDPFAAKIVDNKLYGRGAADMKCAIACFIDAVQKFLQTNKNTNFGIGFLITNDEESDGINGTKKVLEWMKENNKVITHSL
ncbi:MAG: M20/M25/M40 family metallo-hydrolase, partial [Rickettsiales bacterium]|nr:M20/M25/M40 family metallo-hydrolase [Rickettsiales bacterium]